MTATFERVCGSDDRTAWLAARRTGIGASEAPAILGVSPFTSAIAVYTDKVGLGQDGGETEAQEWGRLLEPLILQRYERETGRSISPGGVLLRSTEWPWMLATLDAEQTCVLHPTPGIVEAKSTAYRAGDWAGGEVPRHVWIQIQQQLAVTGRTWGSVCVLLYGSKFLWTDVERDDRFIVDVLVPEGAEFWRRVEQQIPVAPDGSESAARALKALYPDAITGKEIVLPGDLIELDHERTLIKAEMAAAKERLDEIDQTIQAAIGDAEVGTLASGVAYSYRTHRRASYTVAPTSYRKLHRYERKCA